MPHLIHIVDKFVYAFAKINSSSNQNASRPLPRGRDVMRLDPMATGGGVGDLEVDTLVAWQQGPCGLSRIFNGGGSAVYKGEGNERG